MNNVHFYDLLTLSQERHLMLNFIVNIQICFSFFDCVECKIYFGIRNQRYELLKNLLIFRDEGRNHSCSVAYDSFEGQNWLGPYVWECSVSHNIYYSYPCRYPRTFFFFAVRLNLTDISPLHPKISYLPRSGEKMCLLSLPFNIKDRK